MGYRAYAPTDAEAWGRMYKLAYATKPEDVPAWIEKAGPENLRLVEGPNGLRGGLVQVPMGQFWGGRSVRCAGVAGVAVLPEARGHGTATELMTAWLRDAAEAGWALSALYASTRALYRGVGYECAGTYFSHSLPADALRPAGRGDVRPADLDALKARYQASAAHKAGWLDRGPYVWERVFRDADAFEVDGGHAVVVVVRPPGSGWFELHVRDLVATNRPALDALLGHLRGFGSMARTVVWNGAPSPAALDTLVEFRTTTTLKEPWLIRIVRVADALRDRGWPVGLTAEIHLDLADPTLPENAGRWVVQLRDGAATVERGGRGDVALETRWLAPLYSGYRSPWELRELGVLRADDRACGTLAAAFAGPTPAMCDFF